MKKLCYSSLLVVCALLSFSLTTQAACTASFTIDSTVATNVYFHNTSLNTNGTDVGLSYVWDFGDSTSSILKNPIKTYYTAGRKFVKLSIFDSSSGCVSIFIDTLLMQLPACRAYFWGVTNGLTIDLTNYSMNM